MIKFYNVDEVNEIPVQKININELINMYLGSHLNKIRDIIDLKVVPFVDGKRNYTYTEDEKNLEIKKMLDEENKRYSKIVEDIRKKLKLDE